MKRTFALLLTALLALSLTACGNYDGNSTNNTTPDTSVKDSGVTGNGTSSTTPTVSGSKTATGTGLTKNVDGTRVDNGATGTSSNAADNRILGLQNGVASVPTPAINNNGTTPTAVTQSGTNNSVIRGATYGQMLRNARVHDSDGFLLDGENAVTPGAAYR
ncbi:hypothetical protein OBV_42070 [Oscillibacter valericigenes Sjm18-20]|nr:hypothetical protein OBV_42070 [Oscillibacter valericigenes Sjm18-20]